MILLVGAGGIGAPAALALVESGVAELAVVDDDVVETDNLHRQILFRDADVGRPKLEALSDALGRRRPGMRVHLRPGRLGPDTARSLLDGTTVVIDATDNFASRFLAADAAKLAGVPVVHAAAVRWVATVVTVGARGRPCYRCLFEDLPEGPAPDCSTAGVIGPVCGVAGAIAADRALRVLAGDGRATGEVVTYDGRRDLLRTVPLARRAGCALCGDRASIDGLDEARYIARGCTPGAASLASLAALAPPDPRRS